MASLNPLTDVETEQAGPTSLFDVSIVLPTFNEETSVGLCVLEALDACATAGLTAEVIVVDNNCTDDSAEVARLAGARVVLELVPGYGAAIRRGIDAARGAVIVMADADCTYPLDRVAELVRPVLAGEADLTIGSRLDAATRHSMPLLHRFVGTPTLTYLVREGTGSGGLTDSQSGFRAFRRSTALSLNLRATGMEFASEMILASLGKGLRVREIPLGYRERIGESKLHTWADGWRHVKLIVRMSPHLVLWHPGLILTGLALTLFGVSVIDPTGMAVGSLVWQPVFFSTTLLVLGLSCSLGGAVLAHHSPSANPRVRQAFAWVAEPGFGRWTLRVGAGLGLAGLSLDAALLGAWLRSSTIPLYERLTLAGLAQAMLLSGTLLIGFALLYRLIAFGARQAAPRKLGFPPLGKAASSASGQVGGV